MWKVSKMGWERLHVLSLHYILYKDPKTDDIYKKKLGLPVEEQVGHIHLISLNG